MCTGFCQPTIFPVYNDSHYPNFTIVFQDPFSLDFLIGYESGSLCPLSLAGVPVEKGILQPKKLAVHIFRVARWVLQTTVSLRAVEQFSRNTSRGRTAPLLRSAPGTRSPPRFPLLVLAVTSILVCQGDHTRRAVALHRVY